MNSRDAIKKKLSRFILPMLLGAAIMSSIIYDYRQGEVFSLTALSVLFETVIFFMLDALYSMKHKRIGGLIYFVIFIGVLYVMMQMVWTGYRQSYIMFNAWFYAPTDYVPMYMYALIFPGGFLFYSALYYFTQVRYRGLFTLLLVIFPFAIYAKRLDVMSGWYLAAILFFYLLVMVHNRQTAADSGIVVVPNVSYIVSIVTFAAAAVGLMFLIPKPEIQSVQEKDASVFNNLSLFGNETPIRISDFTSRSSREHGILPTGQELFYVNTSEDMLYLKTQSYSYFENNEWHYGADKIEGADYVWTDPAETVPGLSILSKLDLFEEYCEYNGEEEMLAFIKEMRQRLEPSGMLALVQEGYQFKYLALPEGTIMAGVSGTYDKFPADYSEGFRSTTEGNIYCNGEWELRWPTWQYSAEYYSNDEIRWFASQLGLTTEDWDRVMQWYRDNGSDWELYRNVNSDRSQAKLADSGEYDEYDNRIRELALEITEGCESDYEKAVALESYFTQAGFTYDLTYIPDDESIEYFIFDSKTGICSDFATAMTLMARSVGLTARYCEGFIAYEDADYEQMRANLINSGIFPSPPTGWQGFKDNWYTVRDNYAHAFVEVYLPACGWVVFEPTVPSFTDLMMYTPSNTLSFAILGQAGLYIAIGIIAVCVVVLIILFRPITELVFRGYITRISKNRAVQKLYARLVKHISRKTDTDMSAYTVNQTYAFAQTFGIDISQLCILFEKSFYGGKPIDDDGGFEIAFEQYKQAHKTKLRLSADAKRAAQMPV